MTMRALDVWWDDRIVGRLTQDRYGELGFVYSTDWLEDEDTPPLSASLPRRTEPFNRRECRPFFGGLLPEESQREAVAQALGVSRGNDFALLDRLGGDVAGALELIPPGETPAPPAVGYITPHRWMKRALYAFWMPCRHVRCWRARMDFGYRSPARNRRCQWFS